MATSTDPSPARPALTEDVARAFLDRAAAAEPDQVRAERRAFDVLARAWFADPRRALAGRDSGDGYLKFGLPGAEELLTPIFLAASAEVLAYLSQRGVALTRRTVRRVLSLPPADADEPAAEDEAAPAPPLTVAQWTEVRAILERSLTTHARMSPQRAATIAAAVAGDGLTGADPRA